MIGCDKGGVRTDFLTDHLGSVIAEVDQDENVTYRARYSALGQATSSTGTGCGFGWVGSYGYRETGLPHMSHYVRARHYSYITGGWSTVDPLWPEESAYGYVGGRSTAFIDPSGLQGPPPWWWPVTPDPGLGKPKLGPPKPTPGMPPPFPQPVYDPATGTNIIPAEESNSFLKTPEKNYGRVANAEFVGGELKNVPHAWDVLKDVPASVDWRNMNGKNYLSWNKN
jgi:RHS repeat-associated protein